LCSYDRLPQANIGKSQVFSKKRFGWSQSLGSLGEGGLLYRRLVEVTNVSKVISNLGVGMSAAQFKSSVVGWDSKKEEAESVLPEVKSWRDAGDTPYRKNHQEEANL
jgi:hypothetical protein